VPADPSSAAFITIAGVLVPGSHVRLPNVSANPTRIAFVRVLGRMGARVQVRDLPAMGQEPVATIDVRHTPRLFATTVTADEVPALIDEVPVLALVATQADGTTRFEGIGELRVKESDRLEAVSAGLAALGARIEAGEDWLAVSGPTALTGARLSSLGDHRLAMTWAVAGLIARGETIVEGFEAVEVSYPRFAADLAVLGGELR
jgi:3-phosphoshikimate 1-carboxyvinyltransferase